MMVSWAAKNALILFKTLGALVSRQTRERNELVTNVVIICPTRLSSSWRWRPLIEGGQIVSAIAVARF